MSANVKIETLADLIHHGGNVMAICHCGHRSIVSAERMARWYACHGWNTRMGRIGEHLRCHRCRRNPVAIRNTYGEPSGPMWGPVTEDDWRALVKRLRD